MAGPGPLRVWSGSLLVGEEPYLAMTLAHALGHNRFEILASDIQHPRAGHGPKGLYPVEDAQDIPKAY